MKQTYLTGLSAILIFGLTACSDLPGSKGQQGAVIGGASGAAVGAAVTKNRALGAIIGGAAGAAGGYVIGKNSDKIIGKDKSADEAAQRSESNPATPSDALNATTADVNRDGFVTLDEVVAMKNAGLTDQQMVDRLRATGQVFDLNTEQRKYLTDRGVSTYVIDQMLSLRNATGVIGRDPGP